MIKTHLTYLLIVILLILAFYVSINRGSNWKSQAARQRSNVEALRKDTTEKASIIRLTKHELSELFPVIDSLKTVYEKNERQRVSEIHNLKYFIHSLSKGRIDTVYFHDTTRLIDTFRQVLRFEHNCIKTEVHFDSIGMPYEILTGNIEQTTYVSRYRPKWFEYLYKFKYWNKDNRPVQVKTSNNCDLQIKENVIFEIK